MKLRTRQSVPIDEIQPHPRNVREGDVGAIAQSLEQHGQYLPVTVQESSGHILRGNHTWRAMKSLGWTTCAAQYIDVDDDTALRIMLVDNRTNDLASYNDPELAELLIELAGTDLELLGTGFDGDDLMMLLADLNQPLSFEPDDGQPRLDQVEGSPTVECPQCGHVFKWGERAT